MPTLQQLQPLAYTYHDDRLVVFIQHSAYSAAARAESQLCQTGPQWVLLSPSCSLMCFCTTPQAGRQHVSNVGTHFITAASLCHLIGAHISLAAYVLYGS